MSSHQLCNFVTRNAVGTVSGNSTLASSISLGFWSFQDPLYPVCYYYPTGTSFDSKFNSARALATTSIIIGGYVYIEEIKRRILSLIGSYFLLVLL
jgi:hypothetical protein